MSKKVVKERMKMADILLLLTIPPQKERIA